MCGNVRVMSFSARKPGWIGHIGLLVVLPSLARSHLVPMGRHTADVVGMLLFYQKGSKTHSMELVDVAMDERREASEEATRDSGLIHGEQRY